jgi:hypothetical protein
MVETSLSTSSSADDTTTELNRSINDISNSSNMQSASDEGLVKNTLEPVTDNQPQSQQQPQQQQQQQQQENKEPSVLPPQISNHSKEDASSVKFGSIQVREYERIIDSTSIFMGLALGWTYHECEPMPVTSSDEGDDTSLSGKQRTPVHGGDESRMKRTNGSDRYGMMLRYGYQKRELNRATDEAAKFFKQRQREAARSLVVADERKKNQNDPANKKRKPLFGSMFRR